MTIYLKKKKKASLNFPPRLIPCKPDANRSPREMTMAGLLEAIESHDGKLGGVTCRAIDDLAG